ncbi:MFS transporter [Actinotalea ferrariae]|uniref:MFS transporter n=1 Tax=Actinotalea ferrariae TaxID=1386098 RepID=UPI001C8B48E6|nr:MFS transporter [Actinotalea ferrariae]MBX9245616.1 MFS transporter [Actinotalea ferrariae]
MSAVGSPVAPAVAAAPAVSPAAAAAPATAPDDVAAPGGGHRTAALALLVSAQFVVMLDTSIVNVALPSIQRDLGLTPAGLAWVVNAYVLAFGGLLLLAGRVADVVGRRRMLMIGSAVFTLGTLVAGTASTEWLLVAGRVVQGAGAAALSPAAMALLLVTFPGPARARAMAAWGAASTLGGASGVLVGGLLAGTVGWSWIFFATVPVSAIALVAAPRLLDGTRGAGTRRQFDALGAASVTGAVLALVHAALAVPDHGWTSPSVLLGAGVAVALGVVFLAAERRAADPLVPLDVFRSRTLSTGVVLAVLGGGTRASTFVLIALYLQQALRMEPQVAGLASVPTSLAGFVVSVAVLPRVLRVLGPERSMVAGLVVLAGGHLWLARTPDGGSFVTDVLPGLMLVATGVALSFTPTTMVIASAVPAARSGLASGLAGSATQVGAALGMAAFTAIGTAATRAVGAAADFVSGGGFSAVFTAAAVVALATAALGATLVGRRATPSGLSTADVRR